MPSGQVAASTTSITGASAPRRTGGGPHCPGGSSVGSGSSTGSGRASPLVSSCTGSTLGASPLVVRRTGGAACCHDGASAGFGGAAGSAASTSTSGTTSETWTVWERGGDGGGSG